MDLRQFLLDAPETCFYTCYDLILKAADGVRYHLAEYLEIGEVADVAAGGCSLEMVNGELITPLLSCSFSLQFASVGAFQLCTCYLIICKLHHVHLTSGWQRTILYKCLPNVAGVLYRFRCLC
jgi:hypothetical protein